MHETNKLDPAGHLKGIKSGPQETESGFQGTISLSPAPPAPPAPPAYSLTTYKMDQYILGLSCYYHDSAAALLKNGEIIAAAQEERFSRKKHDSRFPKNAVSYCLKSQGN